MPSLGTNLRSAAASVGIPRETARRKVEEMIQAGWLIRVGRDIRFTPRAYQQFTPVRESIERLAPRIHDVIATVVGP
jgi:DNA-binding IclR family transcriptional regulator